MYVGRLVCHIFVEVCRDYNNKTFLVIDAGISLKKTTLDAQRGLNLGTMEVNLSSSINRTNLRLSGLSR